MIYTFWKKYMALTMVMILSCLLFSGIIELGEAGIIASDALLLKVNEAVISMGCVFVLALTMQQLSASSLLSKYLNNHEQNYNDLGSLANYHISYDGRWSSGFEGNNERNLSWRVVGSRECTGWWRDLRTDFD
jgi:hypothetical protein